MIRLGTDTKEEYSPTKKTFYKRRRLFKPLTRLCFITLILSLFALLNHNVRKSLSEHHYYIPKEFSLFHSSAKPLGIPLEHDHLEHLASPAADEEIPIHVFDNLPVRGAYYMVVRNEDLQGAKSVIRSMKDNMPDGKLRYPFIFLNNQDFTPDFRKYIRRLLGSGNIYFGKIDGHAWDYPSFIDVKRAERLMLRQGYKGVYRGYSLSTRQMLRYHAGLYFHHPLFKNVDYSWRVEPGAEYTCQMDTDPFLTMKMKKKKIGYTITMKEAQNTIPTLWKHVNDFVGYHPENVLPANETILPWILNRQHNYNLCHMWSNFEIVDLSFFRSSAYQKYFEYLDNTGNFFYERWGDAPVHTIAAALFLKREEIHFFNDIGYSHSVATHCPYNDGLLKKCSCDIEYNHDFNDKGCTFSLLMLTEPKLLKEAGSYLITKNLSIKDVKLKAS